MAPHLLPLLAEPARSAFHGLSVLNRGSKPHLVVAFLQVSTWWCLTHTLPLQWSGVQLLQACRAAPRCRYRHQGAEPWPAPPFASGNLDMQAVRKFGEVLGGSLQPSGLAASCPPSVVLSTLHCGAAASSPTPCIAALQALAEIVKACVQEAAKTRMATQAAADRIASAVREQCPAEGDDLQAALEMDQEPADIEDIRQYFDQHHIDKKQAEQGVAHWEWLGSGWLWGSWWVHH